MGKKGGGKTLNPADKFRKTQRKKELKKNKEVRKQSKETALLRKDLTQIQTQIAKIEKTTAGGGKVDKSLKIKKRKLESELHEVIKRKKDLAGDVPNREEYERKMTTTVPKTLDQIDVENNHKYENPELSVYYHPTLNPFGAPPPGAPAMFRAAPPGFHGSGLITNGKKEALALTDGSSIGFIKPNVPPPLPAGPPPPPKPLDPPPKPLDPPPKPLDPPPKPSPPSGPPPEVLAKEPGEFCLEEIPLPPGMEDDEFPPLPPAPTERTEPAPPAPAPLRPPLSAFLPPPPNVPVIRRPNIPQSPDGPYMYLPPPTQFQPPPPIPYYVPSPSQFQPPTAAMIRPPPIPQPMAPVRPVIEDYEDDDIGQTILVPTALRVKREGPIKPSKPKKKSKDEAYDKFMKDMKELGAM